MIKFSSFKMSQFHEGNVKLTLTEQRTKNVYGESGHRTSSETRWR